MWTLQDIADEIDAGQHALTLGDVWQEEDRAAMQQAHARARRHFARASHMASTAIMLERRAEAEAEQAPEPATATPEPEDADQPQAPLAGAFLQEHMHVSTAIGGPYTSHTLCMVHGHVRWVMKDAGGCRISVFASTDKAPADAIDADKLRSFKIEGYYRCEMNSALWHPMLSVRDRPLQA